MNGIGRGPAGGRPRSAPAVLAGAHRHPDRLLPGLASFGREEELDRRVTEASDEWPADRLGALERNILRLALLELDRGEVPLEVAIDEAVSLAKRYSSEDAGGLVNGILGRIVREKAT